MAPKAPSHSRQPTKEKEEREEPSSEEEELDPSEDEKGNFSDEEEEEGSSEDEGEDQEKVKSNATPSPGTKFGSKSTVQENGSDSDPDSEGSPSDYKLQPISKSSVVSAKRAHQEGDSDQQSLRSGKKSRTEEKQSSATPGGGFGGITRLWSNEDEIALLNGMIDFRNVKGLDQNADVGAFYDFVKGKLQVDFSRDQLRTKVSRMKKRFLNALKKGGNGLDPVFSKPHDDMAFELSKKIWGVAVGNSEGGKNGNNAKKGILKAEKIGVDEKEIVNKEKEGGEQDFWSKYRFVNESFHNIEGNFPSLAMSEAGMSFVKERLSLIGSVKAKELDDKWKQLIAAEAELNYKMLALMTEQVKMAFGQ
ncbi:UNVERIFIED_CONTAM: STOREKEEPER protein [Sesamum radiatum]|uniref:STOREKEEPER protein n=2 Tax=Sesamum TaxID=4181 RepID=A0AAW2K614_SESRA